MARTMDTPSFITKAQKVHSDLYTYDGVNYVSSKKKITICCRKHGEFHQIPNAHLRGQGCPKCGGAFMDTEFFIEKARSIHDNKYDYSEINYVSSKKKITICCRKHGSFAQFPNSHLNGQGCPECGACSRNKKNADNVFEFIEKSVAVHGNTYDYSRVAYINAGTKVCLICAEHGAFFQKPINHTQGSGCPRCHQRGFNPAKPGTLYYIKDTETGLYKIGITNKTVHSRFNNISRVKILNEIQFENGYEARELEDAILTKYSESRVINESWSRSIGGRTEFFNSDILNMDKEI